MQVINANSLQVAVALYGTFTYGPAVDGTFVPDLPSHLLKRGAFHKGINIMTGHNTMEGVYFIAESVETAQDIKTALQDALPTLRNSSIDAVLNTYYPISSFRDVTDQAATIQGDLAFVCNTYYLRPNYSYVYDVFPALHGYDVDNTFYNGPDSNALQQWVTSFAMTGKPFDSHGDVRSMLLADNGTHVINDEESGVCKWWQYQF